MLAACSAAIVKSGQDRTLEYLEVILTYSDLSNDSIIKLISLSVDAQWFSAAEMLAALLKEDGTYSTVVRHMIEHQLDKVQLLDWLISLHDPTLSTAADYVLASLVSLDTKLLPFEGLFMFLLYHNETWSDIEKEIASLGASSSDIDRAATLVGIFDILPTAD